MFRNYIKVAVRNLMKYPGYTLINILGLAIGMACSIAILLYVRDELAYDRFHDDPESLYRVASKIVFPEQPIKYMAVSVTPLGPSLAADLPEVVAATRLLAYFDAALPGKASVSHGDNEFFDRFFWADSSFFKVFSFRLLQGNPDTVFDAPQAVVITEEMAHKYFGDQDAMGKVLRIDSGFTEDDYIVAGVMENVPQNSHLHLDILASFPSVENVEDERVMMDNWWDCDAYTYIRLAPGADPEEVEAKFSTVTTKNMGERGAQIYQPILVPITDIHLHSQMLNEAEPNSDITYVYIFSTVALVILLVACINFMNLSTARSANRAREVGMRKVVGAHRSQLIGQFLGESLIVSLAAMVVAVLLVQIALPVFNSFVNKNLSLGSDLSIWPLLLLLTLLVALVAGSYPAFFLSSFRPISVLGGTLASGASSGLFRKLLVVTQFTLSIMLIIGTFVIFDQLSYMKNFDLGVDMDRVVVMQLRDSSLPERYLSVKERIEQIPNVEGTALSALLMGKEAPNLGALPDGAAEWKSVGSLIIDQDWVDFYGLEVIAGRNFSKELGDADLNAFLLTESGMRELGWDTPEEALGSHMQWGAGWREGNVIGIVRDFHYQPLKYSIKPIIMLLRPIAYHYLAVRIGPGDMNQTLDDLRQAWAGIFPGRPFEYSFLKDEFDLMYKADEQLGQTIGFFSLVAVFLGCLGLLGLASFTAEQRTKEIGVRKVLGASSSGVVLLLSKEFTKLVVIAIVIAWPVVFFVMREWLSDFAYRTELQIVYFLLGGLIAFAITVFTVGFQSIKAALTNPAEALRYE